MGVSGNEYIVCLLIISLEQGKGRQEKKGQVCLPWRLGKIKQLTCKKQRTNLCLYFIFLLYT